MKRIFYYTDVLPFLSKEALAIDKLKRNLEIFREHSNEITLVWHPWSETVDYLLLNDSVVTEDYQKILRTFKHEGWGILDTSESLGSAREVMLSCNAYYGDISDLVYDATDAGLPVMIQNIEV